MTDHAERADAPTEEAGAGDKPGEEAAPAPPAIEAPARGLRDWIRGAPLPPRAHLVVGLVAPALVTLWSMWIVRSFTVDDAFISFRYARNFARGWGLVYNQGEAIEGYTNFLWTVLLGAGARVGLEPEHLAKVLGGASALGTVATLYFFEARIRPLGWAPCLSPWLYASSIVATGYAVWGLETALFAFLVVLGTLLFHREDAEPRAFPWSGVVFGVAGLTRPEAPLYLGILVLFAWRRVLKRQSLIRGVLFVAPIAAHMLWRHGFYGTWLPNTLSAKTGDFNQQIEGGGRYLNQYATHAGPVLWLALFGLAWAFVERHRELFAVAVTAAAVLGYVLLVGGDWMPYFRFLAPFEPFCFLLVGVGARALFELRERAARLGLVLFLLVAGGQRVQAAREARRVILTDEKVFWDSAAGGAARWLAAHEPGEIGVADIGQIGYTTDYPLFDLLGLVDPVIAKLEGGYTRKTGRGYVDRVFEKMPRYFVFVGGRERCEPLVFPAQEGLRRDRRFQSHYRLGGQVRHSKQGLWCIYERID
jgi:arabinofuranosyltransferase